MTESLFAIKRLGYLSRVHLDSFNFSISQGFFFLNHLLHHIIKEKKPLLKKIKFEFFGFHLSFPKFNLKTKKIKKIPRHCRELKIDYTGDFLAGITLSSNNVSNKSCILRVGAIPIMINSQRCNLVLQKKKQLIAMDEEGVEIGG